MSKRKALLVLVPTRLGLDSIQQAYLDQVKYHFQIPQNVGIAGGKDHMALYLVGDEDANTKSSSFFYLDPHIIQPSVPSGELDANNLLSHLASYHCTDLRSLDPDHMCASMAPGFYLRDESSFEKWARQIKEVQAHFKQDSIYTVFDEKPAFMRELDGDDEQEQSPNKAAAN